MNDRRGKLTDLTFVDCGIGLAGDLRNTDVSGFHAINTKKPIDLNSAENCTFSNVTSQSSDSTSGTAKPANARSRLRNYVGGFSFSKGDHLKKG